MTARADLPLSPGEGPASPATSLPRQDVSGAPSEKSGASYQEHTGKHKIVLNAKWPLAHGLVKILSEEKQQCWLKGRGGGHTKHQPLPTSPLQGKWSHEKVFNIVWVTEDKGLE